MTAADLLELALREKRKAALSDTQAQILLHLARAGEPCRLHALSDALCVTRQSIYEALDGMDEAVSVERSPGKMKVALKAEGVRMLMLLLGGRKP